MKHSFLIIAFLVVGSFSRFCSAQVACNGLLVGTITGSIACNGDCTLDGATISGDVQCSTGSLEARGNTVINGNVMASGLVTRVELDAVNVLGSVTVIGASLLTEVVITQAATLGSVKIENTPGDAVVAGSLTSLELLGSGNLFAADLSTVAIISITGGNGIIEFCGSQIGGLSVNEHIGDIEINANNENCSPTMFLGGLTVNKGSGRVRVIGANLPSGDFIVTGHTGDVTLQETRVSDVLVANTVGLLTLIDVLTDSDMSVSIQMGDIILQRVNVSGDMILEKNDCFLDIVSLRSDGDLTITEQAGNVDLLDFNLDGDLRISGVNGNVTLRDSSFTVSDVSVVLVSGNLTIQDVNLNGSLVVSEISGNVTLTDSNFTLNDVSISVIGGSLTVKNNVQLNLLVQEVIGMVQIIDNVIASGTVNKNTGGVKLCGNEFMFLFCADNVPAPFGSSNVISVGTDQCATGL